MADTSLLLHGVVVDGANGRPAPGVVVLVVDRIEGDPSVMATATSDGTGTVAVPLELDDLVQLFRAPGATGSVERRQPTLHLLGMRSGAVIGRTSVTFTLAELLAGATRATLRVHEAPSTTGCDYVARGRLVFADGSARVGAGIELVQHRLRGESVLATGTTDTAGAFELRYRTATPCDPSSPGLTLSVRARAGSVVLAHSARYCNAPPELEVTLVVGDEVLRGPSTATVLEQALTGRLDGIGLHDLTADEVESLACATRRSARELAWLARSDALAQRTGVSRNVFFALAHAGVPLTLGAVLGLPSTRVRSALTRAQSDNVVPPWGPGALDAIVAALAALALDATYQPSDPRESLLGRLFEHAGVSSLLPRQFVESYLARTGTIAQYWSEFRRDHGDAASDAVQFTLRAASLTGNHVPLVAALQRERTDGRLSSLRAAARRSAAEWLGVLRSGSPPIDAPTAFPGADATERLELYALTLERAFEHAFPTEVTAAVLRDAGGPAQVAAFVERNPSFDFEASHVATFLDDGAVIPPGADANLARDLRLAQRLHAVVPPLGRRTTLAALHRAGVTSARQIHSLGLGGLSHRLPDLDRTVIAQIHERAGQAAAKATILFMKHGAPAHAVPIAILTTFVPPALPTVEGLLGRMDFCACTSCRSIYSPAAYLADILRFLEDRGLLAALVARRPDLVQIRLGCHNTNTVLPTIDLAIEALEDRVAPPPSVPRQTEWSVAELRAHPEHLSAAAYTVLATTTFPWALPFDLRRIEARSYLAHMSVPFAEVLDATLGHRVSARQARAIERLGLSSLQAAIVTGTHAFARPGDPWGLPQADWVDVLGASVRVTLRRAAISYDDLLELGHTSYAGGFTIVFPDDAPCELDSATFIDLTELRLLRMHRFMRLRAALGVSIAELDATVRALGSPGANRVDATFLERLAGHVQLGQRFRSVPVSTRLAWFGRIDTRLGRNGAPSLYDRLFLDRTLAPDNAAFRLDDDRLELDQTPAISDTHRSVIQAALSISEGELAALSASTTPAISVLDLHGLSRLYRRVTLARALGLTIAQLLAIADLSGAAPFADAAAGAAPDVEATLRFVAIADTIRASGSSVAELDYVLRGTIDPATGVGLGDLAVATRFVELIRGLQQIRQDTTRDTDTSRTDRDRLVAALPRVIDPEWIDAAIAFVHERVAPPDGLLEQLGRFLSASARDALLEADDPRSAEQRTTDTLDALLAHLRRVATEDLVVQKLADAVGVDPAMGALLLGRIAVGGSAALVLFARESFVEAIDFTTDGPAIAAGGFPPESWGVVAEQAIALRRLHAAALLVRRFALVRSEVESLLARAVAVGWLDLLVFPDAPVSGPSPAFAGWLAFARIVRARSRAFVDPTAALLALLDAPEGALVGDTLPRLAAAAGWDPGELAFAAETILELDGTALRDADRFEQLVHLFDVLARLGVTAARLLGWTAATTTAAIAQAIKNTARSKVTPEAWPEVIGPLRDRLRIGQRDALVARVLDRFALTEPDQLLGRLLIDVMGDPCQRTSRVKQAIASVQTFVQRVLLALEPGLSLSSDSVREWSWMSRYRVWEANRKVFLYPENYLEPALRGDVTPQFRTFIDEVSGSDGEPQRLEDAYRQYLAGVDDVAHLFVCGVFREREVGADGHVEVNNLHVVARSEGEPHRFHYRKQVDQTYWTPWEEIPGKIEYDTPTPVVWQGKLLLVWLVLREVAAGTAGGAALDAPGSAPAPYFEARLGWAERRNGDWSKARVSETAVDVVFSAGAPSGREAVGFEIRLEGGALVVQPIARLAGSDDLMFVPVHALVLHGDGRVVRGASSVGEQLKEYSEMVWPKHSDPLYQGHRITAEHELSVPYRQPNEATIDFAEVLSLQTDGSTVASRVTDIAGKNVEFSGDAPFFFQDLRRTYLVEPRNVYSPASGSQFGGGFVAVEQTQQHNIGMYVPSQLRLASTPPSPSGAAAVLELAIDAGTTRPMLASQPTWQAKGFDVT
ncbi:MAG: hypothetical protein IAG13_17620, partial [Deltaproteobacteria bacterium]|nr:hypothetical protein [Nannocystaceae bacterium]